MAPTPARRRSLRIALAAMAGMVLGVPAGATPAPAAKAKSCCTRPMPSGCRCCPPAAPACPVPSSEPRETPRPVGLAQVSAPADPCACRPAPPAPREGRPESRPAEERPSEVPPGTLLDSAFVPRQPTPVCALALSPRAGPAPVPLFLRDERLRF
jgi:hypothetical protein